MAPRRLENDAEERRKESVRRETGDGKKTMEPLFLYWQLWRQKTIQTILSKKHNLSGPVFKMRKDIIYNLSGTVGLSSLVIIVFSRICSH